MGKENKVTRNNFKPGDHIICLKSFNKEILENVPFKIIKVHKYAVGIPGKGDENCWWFHYEIYGKNWIKVDLSILGELGD